STGVAFRASTWRLVYDALLPGAHLVAFGGSRTHHRMACAIEDAGFEIRDTLLFLYGSGFPKSLDVSKAIDKRGGASIGWFGPWLREERNRRGISSNDLGKHFLSKTGGATGCVRNWELGLNLPTAEQFNKLCDVLGLAFDRIEEAKREVTSRYDGTTLAVAPGQGVARDGVELDRTAPATPEAAQWAGWGTALKPAAEFIVLARKPLGERTVAANVLRYGTGALHVDACRVDSGGTHGSAESAGMGAGRETANHNGSAYGKGLGGVVAAPHALGRWPANIIHDGSPDVLDAFAAYGAGGSGSGEVKVSGGSGMAFFNDGTPTHNVGVRDFGDTGSAARFFYAAKADKADRADSKHPTVKPVDLMRWLVALVTPPGGRVLDPFAGSGTTGEAAMLLGLDATLIERDAQHAADIRHRIDRWSGSDLPLFADADDAYDRDMRDLFAVAAD